MPWSRRTRFLTAGVVVAALVVGGLVWLARAADDDPPVIGSSNGQCRGFSGEGARVDDKPLLERALAEWQDDIADDRADAEDDDEGDDQPPDELSGDVCVAYAETVGDEVLVTLINNKQHATYVETAEGRRGHVESAGDVSHDLPVLPITSGRWLLSDKARDPVLHVAAGPEAEHRVVQPDRSKVIDVGAAIAARGAKASGVLVVTMSDTLYAVGAAGSSTGGAPYVRLGDGDGLKAVDAALAAPGAVPLVALAIQRDASGKKQPSNLTRDLTLVGRVDVPGVGPAMAVAERADGTTQQPGTAVQLVVLLKDGPQQVLLGTFSRGSGWAGGAWVVGRQDEPDPYVFVAVGVPPATKEAPLSLQVRIGKDIVTKKGPIALVTRADVPGIVSGKTRPATLVIGSRADGSIVPTLGTTQ